MRIKAKVGDELFVHFLDHTEDCDGLGYTVARGRVIGWEEYDGQPGVEIEGWTSIGDSGDERHNRKRWVIATSTVIGYAVIKPEWVGVAPKEER